MTGKFKQTVFYGANDKKITPKGLEEKEITEIIENSYFFGQFMAYYMVLLLAKKVGVEQTLKFADQKFKDIGLANQEFIVQAEKSEKNIKQYYTDTMEGRTANIK
uniref:Uncharacterized protein n=1 Tax=viral metagenome TaxID=1070528 RepID=A0A6M3KCT7_9ZZZZ